MRRACRENRRCNVVFVVFVVVVRVENAAAVGDLSAGMSAVATESKSTSTSSLSRNQSYNVSRAQCVFKKEIIEGQHCSCVAVEDCQ